MNDWEKMWRQDYKLPTETAPANVAPPPGPTKSWEEEWHHDYGLPAPPPRAVAPVARPEPQSTPMEARAQEMAKAGKKDWNVNAPYEGALQRARAHYDHLISIGASPKEALFLTGAAASESNFDPTAVHDSGTGYGLYGHRKERLDAMRAFTGAERPTMEQQNAYALYELRNSPDVALARKALESAGNARDLAIAEMHYERPQGYKPNDPTAGLNFAGRLGSLNKFASFTGDAIPAGELAQKWGPGQSFVSGIAMGFGPQLRAAGAHYIGGRDYETERNDLQRQERWFKEQNPLMGYVPEGLGTLASGGLAMKALAPAAKAAAPAVDAAFQAYAPNFAAAVKAYSPAATRFAGGEAGQMVPLGAEAMPGLGGTATRFGSSFAQGAGQAAGQTALEGVSQGLGGTLGDTETPLTQQFGQNMLMGGVLGAGLSRFASPKAGGVFQPEWEGNLREMGKKALEQYNIPVHPGQFAKGEAKQFFEHTASPSQLNAQVKRFNEEVGKTFGAADLRPESVEAAKKAMGQGYDAIAAHVAPMRATTGAVNKFNSIYGQADNLADPTMKRTVQSIIERLSARVQNGRLDGQYFRNFTQKGGPLDQRLEGLTNPLKKHYGGEIRKALELMLEENNPQAARVLKALNADYRSASTVEKVLEHSGIADPKKVAAAVDRKGASARLRDLAPIGEHLPGVNATGEALGIAKQKAEHEAWRKYGFGLGALGTVANEVPLLGPMLEAGGPLFTRGVPVMGGALMAALAASAGKQAATKLASNLAPVKKQIFDETLGRNTRRVARKAVRPLMHGAVSYNPLYGGEE